MVGRDVVIILHHLIDNAIRSEFDDAIGYGLDKFMVVAGKEYVSTILLQIVVVSHFPEN